MVGCSATKNKLSDTIQLAPDDLGREGRGGTEREGAREKIKDHNLTPVRA